MSVSIVTRVERVLVFENLTQPFIVIGFNNCPGRDKVYASEMQPELDSAHGWQYHQRLGINGNGTGR